MKNFAELIKKCDDHIKAGHANLVSRELSSLQLAKIPREWRMPLASTCRRAFLWTLGLRILSPIIRPTGAALIHPATDQEIVEYAVLLQKNGSIQEALKLLRKIDVSKSPEAALHTAFCLFATWEYEAAIPLLKTYIAAQSEPYKAFVGSVNLAAAFVSSGQLVEALRQLDANIEFAKRNSFQRLLGNCFELRAQVHLRSNRLAQSQSDLDAAAKIFGNEESFDQLFVMKWRSILESLRTSNPEPIEKFRLEAIRRRHWESVREADLYLLKIKFSEAAFQHLMFGTPYSGYRSRILQELKQHPQGTTFLYGVKNSPCLNLLSGKISGSKQLNPGKKIHQILEILLRDLYRPLRIGSLFAEIFPDEYFDVFSSPDRIHQLLRRTRRWIEKNKIPISIFEEDGTYALKLEGDFSFVIPLDRKPVEGFNVRLRELENFFAPGQLFSAHEARKKTGFSMATFQRLALWAVNFGFLEKTGVGSSVRYQRPAQAASTLKSKIAA